MFKKNRSKKDKKDKKDNLNLEMFEIREDFVNEVTDFFEDDVAPGLDEFGNQTRNIAEEFARIMEESVNRIINWLKDTWDWIMFFLTIILVALIFMCVPGAKELVIYGFKFIIKSIWTAFNSVFTGRKCSNKPSLKIQQRDNSGRFGTRRIKKDLQGPLGIGEIKLKKNITPEGVFGGNNPFLRQKITESKTGSETGSKMESETGSETEEDNLNKQIEDTKKEIIENLKNNPNFNESLSPDFDEYLKKQFPGMVRKI